MSISMLINPIEFEDFTIYETKDLIRKKEECKSIYIAAKQEFTILIMSLCVTSFMAIYGFGYSMLNKLSPFNKVIDIAFSIWMLILLPIIVLMIMKSKNIMRSNLSVLEYINNELFIREIYELPSQIRAEKLYSNEKKQIQQFYSLNVMQIKILFPIGIGIIFAGLILIIISLLFVNKDTDNILPILGCISGIITNVIGAMFIKMYIKNLENSISFFNKLVDSSRLLYIDTITARISDEKIRDDTFSDIVKEICKSN